ncbi:uncharacterized protein LOC128641654 [Bombina bombina]|uniref:uncharacterized protein LOC128641654 n=1 Tax=Bombina bombina TaxID=8345 RepID=UPI00235A939A|nr:uncharacterized protein LOC128641654 [Bombina bombina]
MTHQQNIHIKRQINLKQKSDQEAEDHSDKETADSETRKTVLKRDDSPAEHSDKETDQSETREDFNQNKNDQKAEHSDKETAQIETGEASHQNIYDLAAEEYSAKETVESETREDPVQKRDDSVADEHLDKETTEYETRNTSDQNSSGTERTESVTRHNSNETTDIKSENYPGALLELNVHPQTAKLGSDILIPCIFTANKIPVNPKFLAIFWYFQEKEILRYDNIVTRSHRRVSLNTDRAVYGIASLSISNVKISDCGIYKCSVTYSPEKKEKEVTLDVHAPPTITITNNMVEKDIESILHSTITGFYPVKIDIEWLRDKEVLKSVNHSEPQQNSDGTYTVKSSVTLTPTEESKNHNYSIRVQHVSLYEPLQKKIQLVYDATSKPYVLYIVIAIIISIISIVIIALIIKCVRRRRNNVLVASTEGSSTDGDLPLQASEIAVTTCEMEEEVAPSESDDQTGTKQANVKEDLIKSPRKTNQDPKAPEVEEIEIPELIINTEAEFKCKCSYYFPNDLRVKWRQKEGERDFVCLNSRNCRIPDLQQEEQPDGTFTCTAILGFTPSENSQEELEFECTVEHSALKNPITKTTGPLTILEGTPAES